MVSSYFKRVIKETTMSSSSLMDFFVNQYKKRVPLYSPTAFQQIWFFGHFANPTSPQKLCITNKPIPWHEPFHLKFSKWWQLFCRRWWVSNYSRCTEIFFVTWSVCCVPLFLTNYMQKRSCFSQKQFSIIDLNWVLRDSSDIHSFRAAHVIKALCLLEKPCFNALDQL